MLETANENEIGWKYESEYQVKKGFLFSHDKLFDYISSKLLEKNTLKNSLTLNTRILFQQLIFCWRSLFYF